MREIFDPEVGIERSAVCVGQLKYRHVGSISISVARKRPYFPPSTLCHSLHASYSRERPGKYHGPAVRSLIAPPVIHAFIHASMIRLSHIHGEELLKVVAQSSGCVGKMQGVWLLHSFLSNMPFGFHVKRSDELRMEISRFVCTSAAFSMGQGFTIREKIVYAHVSHLQIRTGRRSFQRRQTVGLLSIYHTLRSI